MGKSSIKIGAVKVSGTNTGAGVGIYSGSNPFNTFNFKSLVAAGNLDIISTGTEITISGGSGGGGADGVVSGGTLTGSAILALGRTEGLGNVNIDLTALSGGSGGTGATAADNGLTLVGNTVILGGTLTGDTVIDFNTNNFSITGVTTSGNTLAMGIDEATDSVNLSSSASALCFATIRVASENEVVMQQIGSFGLNQTDIRGASGCISLLASIGGAPQQITLDPNNHMNVADCANSKGFEYDADYSANGKLDPRWIPDWAAVTGLTSGGSGGDGVVSGGTLNGSAILALGRTEGLGNVNIDLTALSGGSGGSATAANGVKVCGDNIVLGGSLTGNTTIGSGNAYGLAFGSLLTSSGIDSFATGCYGGSWGDSSFSAGVYARACGTASVGLGTGKAYGSSSFALNGNACSDDSLAFNGNASGASSMAMGVGSCTLATHAIAMGNKACSTGIYAIAMGYEAYASSDHAIAMGNGAAASNDNTFATGNGAAASGENAIAMGYGAIASGGYSAVIGGEDNATAAACSVVLGGTNIDVTGTTLDGHVVAANLAIWNTPTTDNANTNALVWDSVTKKLEINTTLGGGGSGANGICSSGSNLVLGGTLTGDTYIDSDGNGFSISNNSSASSDSVAFGSNTCADNISFAVGCNTIASGSTSAAFGKDSIATGNMSHASGCLSKAYGTAAFAEGFRNCAFGSGSHAEGGFTCAYGFQGHSEGRNTCTIGNYSHSEGFQTVAYGFISHAEGSQTHACGVRSHSEGNRTCALGDNSHAQGLCNYALGTSSHAEGFLTCAIGNNSHAEGDTTIACGCRSHSGGYYSYAIGNASHASGYGYSGYLIRSSGLGSFNHSTNNISQTTGHGALADNSAILGGCNHNIESGNVRSAIIGGNSIKLTGTSYIDTTAVDNLAIMTAPSAGGSNDLLTWESGTSGQGVVKKITQASISDGRLKNIIKPIESPLEGVVALNGYEYEFNDKMQPKAMIGQKRYGLIAQEVKEKFPLVVKNNLQFDDALYMTVEYRELVPVLVEAIKELNDKNIELEDRITFLENK